MDLSLPPERPFKQLGRHADGWTDHYGSLFVAAGYAGVMLPQAPVLTGLWQHGVFGPWQHFSPDVLTYNAPGARSRPVYVARPDQADFLRANGYAQVEAIGLPILYTPNPEGPRIPGSLLVLPTHSLVGDRYLDRSPFERYAETIKALIGRFSNITVCIHPNCRLNGNWVKEFTVPGIEIVYGATTGDANALARMRSLFERFESVTTNDWGSHVAYALAFGARVSIAGHSIHGDPAVHRGDEMWKHDPQALALAFSPEVAAARGKYLARLYVNPTDGVKDVAWGRELVGADQMVSPEKMRSVLARIVSPEPRPLAGPRVVGQQKPVLFVSHEASRTGAPMFLLHLVRWLRANTSLDFEILLGKGGPLQAEFAQVAVVHEAKAFQAEPHRLQAYDLIYSNTVCNGLLLGEFDCGDVPIITHAHELEMGYQWLGARNMASVIRQSSRFVACAQAVAERMQQVFNLPADRFSVHYEMIDPEAVAVKAAGADLAQLRAQYDLPEDAFIVTGCGTLDLRKAPDLFVQLASRVKERLGPGRPLRFLWIGAQNNQDLLIALLADIRKLGLDAEVRLIAELPSPHALIALSDLFCLTSREDPFPLVMLEAGALGKPVVCFGGSGGAAEFCAAGGGQSVPYLDVVAMADLVCSLLQDADRRTALGRRAASVVRERFSVSAVAPRLWRELQQHLTARLPVPAERSQAVSWGEIYCRWNARLAPQPAFIAAHLARAKLRAEAQRLVVMGRRKEAVQVLVKAVTADLGSKKPHLILEALLEIAADMAPLDPRQSAALMDKARMMVSTTGLRVEQFQPSRVVAVAA